ASVDALGAEAFGAPAHRAVWDGVVGAGGIPSGSAAAWTDAVVAAAPAAVHPLVAELAVAPLPVTVDRTTGLPSRRFAAELVTRLREVGLTRRVADALGQLRRLDSAPDPDPASRHELGTRLQALQRELAAIRDTQEA
ncbi:MAG: DNA primase, partial [Lapillicoccus sp.]